METSSHYFPQKKIAYSQNQVLCHPTPDPLSNNMLLRFILIFVILFPSCTEKNPPVPHPEEVKNIKLKILPNFESIIDSSKVRGAVLIYDLRSDTYYSNDFEWARVGRLPASTYKIPNSIIGLETGVVKDDSTIFKWDGQKRRIKNWEQDLTFRQAFHLSCVPCYQEIARHIGLDTMKMFLSKYQYGDMVVDSTTLDLFWLEGDSKINQFQQIAFLKNFYTSTLAVSKRTESIMKDLMVIEEKDGYRLSGKTGWSIRNGNNNGWFVGYLEKGEDVFFFATNVSPTDQFNMKRFPKIRKEITYAAFKELDIIKQRHDL